MKRGDVNKLVQIPCPICKLGRAVHKKEAYSVATSKKYIKLRKAAKKNPQKPLPTVGQEQHIEAALLNTSFINQLRDSVPSRKINIFDTLFDSTWMMILFRILLVGLSLGFAIWLIENGFESEPAAILGQVFLLLIVGAVWGIWYWLETRIEKLEADDIREWLEEERSGWICLRCHNHFICDVPSKAAKRR